MLKAEEQMELVVLKKHGLTRSTGGRATRFGAICGAVRTRQRAKLDQSVSSGGKPICINPLHHDHHDHHDDNLFCY